ncbi:MAG: TonB-dependent receptor plug domain-containing protein [Paludibacteraceae bacterium]|nr:TonB-dependent receptor plug domain-containing protein [Paludibacteraceae bacterium]
MTHSHPSISHAWLIILLLISGQMSAQWRGDTLEIQGREIGEISVIAPRVQQATASHSVVTPDELQRENIGQNLPLLLSTIPAIQVTSDDGLGVGYTYFRIRGTDHTRINMTVNDVPLNDSESQTVFWVNMTDLASSISSIDVQRGVGTSTNGVSSFGASLNMQTHQDPHSHVDIAFNGGMYNTFREMISAHVALPKNLCVNARFSKVNSDGFLYRTNSDLYSYYADFGYNGERSSLFLRFFGGKETTGMGWDGVDYNTA